MIDNVVSDTVPWRLGHLQEGWEWIAFTFQDQLPFELSEEEINELLASSNQVVQTAYSRMDLSKNHKWATHTPQEIDYILEQCTLSDKAQVIDWGCGQGRHSIELAKRGYSVTGIDYLDCNIEAAKKNADSITHVHFITGDCRTVSLGQRYDLALCLYDVIGSYVEKENNIQILENIYKHLKNGGIAVISVMNRHSTEIIAKNTFSLKQDPNKLLSLAPSQTMETNGNIFNPDYFLLDSDTGVVYRREQFRGGRSLPVELIVRDKRFYSSEIISLCQFVGFSVQSFRFINASDWRINHCSTSEKAKEILLILKKSI